MQKTFKLVFMIIVPVSIACSSAFTPVDIEHGDMCSFCRMAISENRYAAEIINEDETVLKFDDIGCMLRYRKADNGRTKLAATYVANSETKGWLKADDAYFVRSTTIKTPMSSGIVAFSSTEKAGEGALRFAQLEEK